MNIGIVISEYNKEIANNLLDGATDCYKNNFKTQSINDCLDIYRVPGAFEIPSTVNKILKSKKYEAIVTLGCVIKGETAHFEYISSSVINALSQISLNSDIPIALGILTCYNYEQALLRATSRDQGGLDKGGEVMKALLQTIEAWDSITK